jgi:hypothetical protein
MDAASVVAVSLISRVYRNRVGWFGLKYNFEPEA